MRYAIYRCLYGEDFIQKSIKSIEKYFDKIFVFWDDKVWGDVTECTYRGEIIKYPDVFDSVVDKITKLNNPKIELIYDHRQTPFNQFTYLINSIILTNYEKPDTIMVIEVDHVFRKDQIEKSLEEFESSDYQTAHTNQIELWKTPDYYIQRKGHKRTGTVFWNMNRTDRLPDTGTQANIGNMPVLSTSVHNLGFCVSEKVMFWKHLTAIGFSQKIGDSIPNESWYEEKWLSWDYDKNNKDLEISAKHTHYIPRADKYSRSELPEELRK